MKKFKKKTYKIRAAIIVAVTVILICILKFCILNGSSENTDEYLFQQQLGYASETSENMAENTKNELEGTIIVNYIDESGEKIIESTTKKGKVGEEYDIERPYIKGFKRYGEDPITRAGVYGDEDINVDFIYKESSGDILAGVNREGENGATANEVNILIDNPKLQSDYGLRIITKDENNTEINGGEFTIKKDNVLLRKGNVLNGSFYAGKIAINKEGDIVYNIEQTGETIGYGKLEEVINLNLHSVWNDEKATFDVALGEIGIDGVTADIRDVKKLVTKKDGNNESTVEVVEKEIVVEIINKKYKDMYEVEVVNKSKNETLTGGKFKVESESKILIDDFIVNKSLHVGDFDITEEGTDRFVVYETGTAKGYLKTIDDANPGIVVVTKKYNDEQGIYELTAQDNDIPGFSAIMGEDRKLTIYVESEKEQEKTPDPIQKYDLCIKKFIAEIDGEATTNREPKVTIENNKVKYTQENEIEKVANNQEITYILRIYNESNVAGTGKRVIEYIPDGLEFLPEDIENIEYGWNLYKQDKDGDLIQTKDISEATVIATDYLVDKEIAGFDISRATMPKFLDIRVKFKVNESKITSSDRIIENIVEIQKNENDDNSDNDKTSEKAYVKYFDLGVEKYIKEVKINNSKGETIQTVGEDKKDQLFKIDLNKDLLNETTLTITYVLKVTNIGEIAGYATELIDYIPQDFKLIENETWTQKEGKAVTSKLENKLLQPGESATVEIAFNWNLTLDNIGSRINEGKISKYENDYNAKAITTNDNVGRVEILTSVKTGNIYIYITMGVLAVLVAITGVAIICKSRKK